MKKIEKRRISNGVMKIQEFDDLVLYNLGCSCGEQDHSISVCIEYDKELKLVTMEFYKKLYWASCGTNFIKRFLERIKCAVRILFTGYIEVEELFIFNNNQIDDVIYALSEGKQKIEEYINENKKQEK